MALLISAVMVLVWMSDETCTEGGWLCGICWCLVLGRLLVVAFVGGPVFGLCRPGIYHCVAPVVVLA